MIIHNIDFSERLNRVLEKRIKNKKRKEYIRDNFLLIFGAFLIGFGLSLIIFGV